MLYAAHVPKVTVSAILLAMMREVEEESVVEEQYIYYWGCEVCS